jgi:hypothetical protein
MHTPWRALSQPTLPTVNGSDLAEAPVFCDFGMLGIRPRTTHYGLALHTKCKYALGIRRKYMLAGG